MEKIYEEQFNKTPNNGGMYKFSILLSFFVALFAVVSLIAFGFNQISYAAPMDGASTVTLHAGKFGSELAQVVAQYTAPGEASVIQFSVPMRFSDNENAAVATAPLYCVQHDVSEVGSSYTSDEEIADPGLVYILNQSKLLGGDGFFSDTDVTTDKLSGTAVTGFKDGITDAEKRYLDYYATQVAIWVYLDYKGDAHNQLTEDQLAVITEHSVEIFVNTSATGETLYTGNFYDNYVADIVEDAITATNHKTVHAVRENQTISLYGDDDIYQTSLISVVADPSDDLKNYSVELSGLDGAYIVDENYVTKSSIDTFAPGAKFRILIPVNKVSDSASTVNVKISADFDGYYTGEYYVASGSQTVAKLTDKYYRIDNNLPIDFLAAPDTGVGTAQTIYFIGLIVLLCGIGIIYANAKPVEEK